MAKCEQKQTYAKNLGEQQSLSYYNPDEAEYPNPHQYFKQFQEEFVETQYYDEVIEECLYFKEYVVANY